MPLQRFFVDVDAEPRRCRQVVAQHELLRLAAATFQHRRALRGAAHANLERDRFIDQADKNQVLGKISDWKLVYRTPGKMTEMPVPFEFKDVPLP